jgi:hypothetical protein
MALEHMAAKEKNEFIRKKYTEMIEKAIATN